MKHTINAMERPLFLLYFWLTPNYPRACWSECIASRNRFFLLVTAGVGMFHILSGTTGNSKHKYCFTFEFSPLLFPFGWLKLEVWYPQIRHGFPTTAFESPDFKAAFEVGFSILLGARAGWLSSRDEWQMWGKSFWTVGIVGVTWQF